MSALMLWVASTHATRYLWDKAKSAVNFTSTPGNKEIITSPQDATQLNTEAA
ncbi:MAG TPA: hypothetical protein V6D09_22250 [Leptolyngbyaceae cyanobacterium]